MGEGPEKERTALGRRYVGEKESIGTHGDAADAGPALVEGRRQFKVLLDNGLEHV